MIGFLCDVHQCCGTGFGEFRDLYLPASPSVGPIPFRIQCHYQRITYMQSWIQCHYQRITYMQSWISQIFKLTPTPVVI